VPVRDREERLTKLFLNPSPQAIAQAGQIQEESARFNLGEVRRTINNPVFALMMLQPEFQSRFQFTLGRQEKLSGEKVWVVEFREEERPTIIRGLPGQEMPARGRFWIAPETGRVVKTELVVDKPEIRANVTTLFRTDDRFQISVPTQMHEDYELDAAHVTGTATYDHFRQFQVRANEELARPPQ
jgi:hypothetical protein